MLRVQLAYHTHSAHHIRTQVKPGAIELHPSEDALVVHYEVQEVEQGQDGSSVVSMASACSSAPHMQPWLRHTELHLAQHQAVRADADQLHACWASASPSCGADTAAHGHGMCWVAPLGANTEQQALQCNNHSAITRCR